MTRLERDALGRRFWNFMYYYFPLEDNNKSVVFEKQFWGHVSGSSRLILTNGMIRSDVVISVEQLKPSSRRVSYWRTSATAPANHLKYKKKCVNIRTIWHAFSKPISDTTKNTHIKRIKTNYNIMSTDRRSTECPGKAYTFLEIIYGQCDLDMVFAYGFHSNK